MSVIEQMLEEIYGVGDFQVDLYFQEKGRDVKDFWYDFEHTKTNVKVSREETVEVVDHLGELELID